MNKNTAALYLRSSKDRSDVSIDAQRRELQELAAARGLTITHEYADVVLSAKTADRPQFQRLLLDLKRENRGWSTLLTVDTSRLSRRRYWAQAFKHQATKHGVSILYSKVPDVDPITQVILESVLEAMDEVHSLMSREKGLAGMAENVRKGFRAGGRAPRGYRLVRIETATFREGKPVEKTRLETTADAPIIRRYMKGRAAGRPRAALKRSLGIEWSETSLIGMEWQALTYAGYTAWGMHNGRQEGGYVGGRKRRPRSGWTVSPEPTHEALITLDEAESILTRLETSAIGQRVSEGKRAVSAPLLTGLLVTSDGRKWTADRRYYRLGNEKYVPQADVDAAILARVESDLKSPESVRRLVRAAQKSMDVDTGPLKRELASLEQQIARTVDLAASLEDPAPVRRRLVELERDRGALREELAEMEREREARRAVASISPSEIQAIVTETEPRRLLDAVVAQITLDPDMSGQITYRLSVASPRRAEGYTISASWPLDGIVA